MGGQQTCIPLKVNTSGVIPVIFAQSLMNSIAGLASEDGRHLAMMPHLERAVFPWQNAYYPADRVNSDQVTPWIEAFVNARKWVEKNMK